jgi:hypothetical protein
MKNCNYCSNRECVEHASIDDNNRIELRHAPNPKLDCKGFKEYQKPTFSLMELAMRKSIQEVISLLAAAKLQIKTDNSYRGFNFVKG